MSVDLRGELVRLMRATLADNAEFHTWTYRAVRPLPVTFQWRPGLRVEADCSHALKLLCKWAGAPDPMGTNFGPYGNSATLALHLQHLERPGELLAGDIVTFGPGGRDHAAMVLEPGLDPLLWSNGHVGAPNLYRLSQDRRERQFLRLPVPRFTPSPEDRLRGRTGFWSWMQWGLAEGDWRDQRRADPAVRPNVPRLIPMRWWQARLRFLIARRKPNDLPC